MHGAESVAKALDDSFSPSLSGPAGAIVSTVGDVAGFYRALLSGQLLEPALVKAMKTTIPATKADLNQRMGLGLERFQRPAAPPGATVAASPATGRTRGRAGTGSGKPC